MWEGSERVDHPSFGKPVATLAQDVIPTMMVDLGHKLQKAGITDFYAWQAAHYDEFVAFLKDYE